MSDRRRQPRAGSSLPVQCGHGITGLLAQSLHRQLNRPRAAEDYPYDRYGLSTGVAWPRLWLAMPDGARDEITAARERLGSPVRVLMWSCLAIIWPLLFAVAATRVAPVGNSLLPWLILAAVVAGVWWGYSQAVEAAGSYGDLLRSAFDVHRVALYESLGWPIGEDERARGEAVTQYLWRGELP